jgi:hypothetical protein
MVSNHSTPLQNLWLTLLMGINLFLLALSNMYAQGLQSEQATRNVLLNPSDNKAKDNYKKANSDFIKYKSNQPKNLLKILMK